MNSTIKFFKGIFLMVCLCCVLSGCSILQDGIKDYSSGKEQCYLVSEDVTQFTYKEETYTILNNTVSNDGLGEWLGYIRQLAAVDKDGTVLVQEAIETASFETLSDLAEKAPDAKYIIPFLNVYAAPNNASHLIVDVNGGYHEAVPSDHLTAEDEIFDFKAASGTNPADAVAVKVNNQYHIARVQ